MICTVPASMETYRERVACEECGVDWPSCVLRLCPRVEVPLTYFYGAAPRPLLCTKRTTQRLPSYFFDLYIGLYLYGINSFHNASTIQSLLYACYVITYEAYNYIYQCCVSSLLCRRLAGICHRRSPLKCARWLEVKSLTISSVFYIF